MQGPSEIDKFISEWTLTGGSELANAQSFVNGLCALLSVDAHVRMSAMSSLTAALCNVSLLPV